MFNVIILSSGLSSRLKPITNNIPKLLVNVGNETALMQQTKYWNAIEGLDKIYVVIHPNFIKITEAYIAMNKLENIEIISEPESNGSFEAIRNAVATNPELQSDVFLNWSDLIPVTPVEHIQRCNIVYRNGNQHRYGINSKGSIENVGSGGDIPGLYYIQEFPDFDKGKKGDDLIDHMKSRPYMSQHIDEIIDFGDIPKLTHACTAQVVSREFNSVEINADTVVKTAMNKKGKDLQKKELKWYSKTPPNTPKILKSDEDSFTMERAKGQPLYQCYEDGLEQKALQALAALHETNYQSVSQKVIERDLKIEVVDKTYDRKKSIQGLLNGFGKVETINGKPLIDFDEMCTILYDRLSWFNQHRTSYAFIHGDPNFSNTMYDGNKITFIDPRGYFGETRLYGPETYDQAKVLYALSGYDNFNADAHFGNYELDGTDLKMMIPPLTNVKNIDPANSKLFNEESYTWLALIWTNLGGYFKNNPLKAVLSYYYGLHLASWLIEDRFPKKRNGYNELYRPIDLVIHTKVPFKWNLTDKEYDKYYSGQGPGPDMMWKSL
jgi:hypothetical protein